MCGLPLTPLNRIVLAFVQLVLLSVHVSAQNEVQGDSSFPSASYLHLSALNIPSTGNLKCYRYLKVKGQYEILKMFSS